MEIETKKYEKPTFKTRKIKSGNEIRNLYVILSIANYK